MTRVFGGKRLARPRRLPAAARRWLLYAIETAEGWRGFQDFVDVFIDYETGRKLWFEHRDALVQEFVARHPGRRPWPWYENDAPREQGSAMVETRQKVSGSGYENAILFAHGINGCAGCDPADPPLVESEAAYLKRHGLLLPGEAQRLKARDYRPVRLVVDEIGHAYPPEDLEPVPDEAA